MAPSEMVVFEEDPIAAARLSSLPGYASTSNAVGFSPSGWEALRAWCGATARPLHATVFLHERRSKGGLCRVIAVDVHVPRSSDTIFQITTHSWEPRWDTETIPAFDEPEDVRNKGPGFLRVTLQRGAPPKLLRAYAGQPDPTDSAAFSFKLQLGDQTGIVCGTLNDDGRCSWKMSRIDGVRLGR